MKKLCAMFISLILAACMCVSAFAMNVQPYSSGTGYESGIITKNNKNYSCTVSIGFNNSTGAHTTCSTQASCARDHGSISLKYDTEHHGILTRSGGAKYFTECVGVTTSPQTGLSYPGSCVSASATVTVRVRNQNNTLRMFTFSPYL